MKMKRTFFVPHAFALFLRLVCLEFPPLPRPICFFLIQVSVLPESQVFPRHYFQGQRQVEAISKEPSNAPEVFHSGGQFSESL